ncbi:glycosyltransferase [Humibacter sp.]|uniref:glycosyltransferase n=1 Tax=Humibacter sp. TaxID=1940291 RepID=UPI002D7FF599|nr:glycosyltransferase [Humibacter sp.]
MAVSVVIPAFNPGPFLAIALDSLVTQTFTSWEAVVVDDGSHEPLSWVAGRDPRITLLRQTNQGLSAARNAGILATTAPLIAFLDADDVWLPGKLDSQVARLTREPGLGMLSTAFAIIDSDGRITGPGYQGFSTSYEELLGGNGVCVSTAVVRRAALEQVGLFDTGLRTAQDWDLWLRIARVGAIDKLPEVLAHYRIHSGGMTQDWRLSLHEAEVVLRRHPSPRASRGLAAARERAVHQAFDAARAAARSRRLGTLSRNLAYVAAHRPSVLARAVGQRLINRDRS